VGFMRNTGSEWRKDGFWGGRKLDPAGFARPSFISGCSSPPSLISLSVSALMGKKRSEIRERPPAAAGGGILPVRRLPNEPAAAGSYLPKETPTGASSRPRISPVGAGLSGGHGP